MLAGPGTSVPGAQCPGALRARLALFAGLDPAAAQDAEWGLRAVEAGPAAGAPWPADTPPPTLPPPGLLLSAPEPAAERGGVPVRVVNPEPAPGDGGVTVGFPRG